MKIVTKNGTTRGRVFDRGGYRRVPRKYKGTQAMSRSAVYRIMKRNGANSVELITKPGLNKEQQWQRLKWVLEAWNWFDNFLYIIA